MKRGVTNLCVSAVSFLIAAACLFRFLESGDTVYLGVSAISGMAVILSVYYFIAGMASVAVFLRALLAIFPVGALGAILVWCLLQVKGLDDGILKAMIAAVVVATGWVVGFVTTEWRNVNTEQERRRDMIEAVIVEIDLIAKHNRAADWDAITKKVTEEFENDENYYPYIFIGHEYSTLMRLVDQVEILEFRQIESVMALVQILKRLDRMETHINSDDYRKLPKDRRLEGVLRFLRLHGRIGEYSEKALENLQERPFYGVFWWVK